MIPLYKYCPPERIDILERLRIAFTPPNRFNDLWDCAPRFKGQKLSTLRRANEEIAVRELLVTHAEKWRHFPREERRRIEKSVRTQVRAIARKASPQVIEQLNLEGQNLLSQDWGILSLASNPDEELMWAHYAKDHTGFVVEFCTDSSAFSALGCPRKVSYVEEQPWFELGDPAPGVFYVKSAKWKYECEWRLVRPLAQCENERAPNGMDIFLAGFAVAAVKTVILGVRISPQLRERVSQICRTHGFQVRQITQSAETWGLRVAEAVPTGEIQR
jgi:hypothetical protein